MREWDDFGQNAEKKRNSVVGGSLEKGKKGAPRNPSQPRCMRMRSGKTGNV